MDSRCSDDALEVVYRAEVSSIGLDIADFGTPGLLIGLLDEKNSIASLELQKHDLDTKKIIKEVQRLWKQRGEQPFATFERCFTEKSRILNRTLRIRRDLGHHDTYAEHILISILMNKPNEAIEILTTLGVNCESLMTAVIQQMKDDDKFAVILPNTDIYHSTYIGKLVGLSLEAKHAILNPRKKKGLLQEQDSNSEVSYQEIISRIKAAHERANQAFQASHFSRHS